MLQAAAVCCKLPLSTGSDVYKDPSLGHEVISLDKGVSQNKGTQTHRLSSIVWPLKAQRRGTEFQ